MKSYRMSFRISEDLDEKINLMVDRYSHIRDRSDLGNKALLHYIKYIDNKNSDINTIKEAILILAKEHDFMRKSEIRDLIDL